MKPDLKPYEGKMQKSLDVLQKIWQASAQAAQMQACSIRSRLITTELQARFSR